MIAAAIAVVPESKSGSIARGFDMDGLLLSAIGFGAFVFAVIEGNRLGWWKPKTEFAVFGMA